MGAPVTRATQIEKKASPLLIDRPRCQHAAKISLLVSAILFGLTIVILGLTHTGNVDPLIGLGTFCSSLFFSVTALVFASFISKGKRTE